MTAETSARSAWLRHRGRIVLVFLLVAFAILSPLAIGRLQAHGTVSALATLDLGLQTRSTMLPSQEP